MLRPVTAISALISVAALSGCGTTTGGHGQVDDQRATHLTCMQGAGLTVTDVGQTDASVASPSGPIKIHFDPSPGSSQQDQIAGAVQGAEVIGNALLYPGTAPDSELSKIENCLAIGVTG